MKSSHAYLRIIAGEFRGRDISGPGNSTTTRPTSDRVREALFDILGRSLRSAQVLDICAGTGALGLEAISRGATSATFVEGDPRNVKLIHENIQKLQVTEKTVVLSAKLPYAMGRVKGGPYDIVFIDPPYESDLVESILPRLKRPKLLSSEAMIVVERDRRNPLGKVSTFAITRRHRIGDTELWFLQPGSPKKESEDGEGEE